MRELLAGRRWAVARILTSRSFSGLFSTRKEGPETPRIPAERTISISPIHGWKSANARAPRSPSSSPSRRIRKRSFLRGSAETRARAVSRTVATPTPPSPAPGERGLVS